ARLSAARRVWGRVQPTRRYRSGRRPPPPRRRGRWPLPDRRTRRPRDTPCGRAPPRRDRPPRRRPPRSRRSVRRAGPRGLRPRTVRRPGTARDRPAPSPRAPGYRSIRCCRGRERAWSRRHCPRFTVSVPHRRRRARAVAHGGFPVTRGRACEELGGVSAARWAASEPGREPGSRSAAGHRTIREDGVNGIGGVDGPSVTWGWLQHSGKGGVAVGGFFVLFPRGMVVGNHLGHVEDIWLV